jgi:hypothetical protein
VDGVELSAAQQAAIVTAVLTSPEFVALARQATLTNLLEASILTPPGVGIREPRPRRIVRGDESTQVFTLGENLTGRTAKFCLKRKRTDANASAIVEPTAMTVNDEATGEVQITLTEAQTATAGSHVWDIQTEDTADGAHVRTLKEGEIVIQEDVGK